MEKEIEYIVYNKSQESFFQDLLVRIKSKKLFIYIFLFCGLVIGSVIGITTPRMYKSETIVLPQMASGGLAQKYNIASLIGFNLGKQEGNDVSPMLYPVLAESANFRKDLLDSEVKISSRDQAVTYSEYLEIHKKNSLFDKLINFITVRKEEEDTLSKRLTQLDSTFVNEPIYLNKGDIKKMNYLEQQMSITFAEDQGYISLVAKSQDPLVASTILSNAQFLLEKLIIEVNVQKSINEMVFIDERLKIARDEYILKRARLGAFRDKNQYSITSRTSNREEQLKSEYDLSYEIYSQLASQKESTKLQIAKQTPIFSIIKPIVVPTKPEGPGALNTIFLYSLISLILALLIVSIKVLIKHLKKTFTF